MSVCGSVGVTRRYLRMPLLSVALALTPTPEGTAHAATGNCSTMRAFARTLPVINRPTPFIP